MKIQKTSGEFKIIDIENSKTFAIEKNNEKIIVHDEELIENLINKKFSRKYCELLYIINDILNSDEENGTDDDLLALKIEDLRNELLNRYNKFINKSTLNKYLKMLDLLEDKLNSRKKARSR